MEQKIKIFDASRFKTSFDESDFLGNGSYATVRRCQQNELGNVVVKCFALTGSDTAISGASKTMEKEAEVLSRLQHSNIITFHGVTKWESCYGLVMEEATGYNLEDLFIHEPDKVIPWQLRGRILYDIANGLDYLHNNFPKRSYIHGDLKLQNILLNENLIAKIADFGAVDIALASGAYTASLEFESSKQYTPLYSPPELLKDLSSKKKCSMDMYSYGLIGYEIITRQRIFQGPERTPIGTMVYLIQESGQKPNENPLQDTKKSLKCLKDSEIFCELENIVKSCWTTEPDQRPTAKTVKTKLEKFQQLEALDVESLKKKRKESNSKKVSLNKFEPPFRSTSFATTSSSTSSRYYASKRKKIYSNSSRKRFKKGETGSPGSSIDKDSPVSFDISSSNKSDSTQKSVKSRGNENDEERKSSKANFDIKDTATEEHLKPTDDKHQEVGPPIETKKFKSILENIKNREKVILHCYGVPGSGTSHIVRELGERFPFVDDEKAIKKIKSHIRCKDSGHDVKEELKKLADELRKREFIANNDNHELILNELDNGSTDYLVQILLDNVNAPVVFLVEDPTSEKNHRSKKLLQSLMRNLSKSREIKDKKSPIHLYVSSRFKTPILEDEETIDMAIYVKETITGFSKQESLEYLKFDGYLKGKKNEIGAEKVFEHFKGLPLGLQIAKGYCIDIVPIDNYQSYLELVKRHKYEIITKEKDAVMREFGDSAEQLFQAIVMPLVSNLEIKGTACLDWKIIRCLSYFNYHRIPKFVIEYCFTVLCEEDVEKLDLVTQEAVRKLINDLLRFDMCKVSKDKEIITFHEVVSNAFRLNRHSVLPEPFNPLKKAIEVMCGLVSKDTRKKDQSEKMYKLRRHLQTLLEHVIKNEAELYDYGEDCFMFKALASHLFENASAIMLDESPALFMDDSNRYFDQALKLISKDLSDMLDKEFEEKNLQQVAKNVVAESIENGKTLPNDFILEYASKLSFIFDEEYIAFLQSRSQQNDFGDIGKFMNNSTKRSLLQKFQECQLFLSNEKFASIFHAERVASILHSYSRLALYTDSNTNNASKNNKCIWMSKLCQSISIECRKTCDVSLLTERLSQTGGWVPLVRKLKKTSIEDNVKARDFCTNALSEEIESTDMYENGLLREVYGPSKLSTRISLLRSITRVNARLVNSAPNQVNIDKADKFCEDLLALAIENAFKMSNAVMCIVYCAKYYAARKCFAQWKKCFDHFFQKVSEQEFNFNVRSWAVYNYARAAISFGSKADAQQKDAIDKCKQMLNDNEVLSRDLSNRLKKCLEELQKNQEQ